MITSCSYFVSFFPSSALLSFLCQGMVYSAEYIKKKLEQEMILSQAFGRDLVRHSVYYMKLWQDIKSSTKNLYYCSDAQSNAAPVGLLKPLYSKHCTLAALNYARCGDRCVPF